MSVFGELLKSRRNEKGMTLRALATRAGIDAGNLSKIERGRLDPPQDEDLLERLIAALGYRSTDPKAVELQDLAYVQNGRFPPEFRDDTAALLRAISDLRRRQRRH